MQLGVFAKTFSGDRPDKILAACKNAGFGLAQYNMSCSGLDALPTSISDEASAQIRYASHTTGVKIAAVSATYNMTDPDHDRRKVGRNAFKTIAENAAGIGTELMTVCSGSMDPHDKWRRHPTNDEPQSWTEMCREFEIILDYAEQHEIMVGVEPEDANIVNSAPKALRLLKHFPGSRIRIVFDPANIIESVPVESRQRAIDEALDILGPEIIIAHAKDRLDDGSIAPAGAGIIRWSHVLLGLSQIGFHGPLIAHGISESDAPAVAKFLGHELEQL